MISNKWLYLWKCFILNKICEQKEDLSEENEDWSQSLVRSLNPVVGILPPGMISNEEDLFDT